MAESQNPVDTRSKARREIARAKTVLSARKQGGETQAAKSATTEGEEK